MAKRVVPYPDFQSYAAKVPGRLESMHSKIGSLAPASRTGWLLAASFVACLAPDVIRPEQRDSQVALDDFVDDYRRAVQLFREA
jgi:hypothetical protein